MIAQNLIVKKQLRDNILLLGNTGPGAAHFYDTYELMKISTLWNKQFMLGDLYNGVFHFNRFFLSYFRLVKFNKRISRIIMDCKVDQLFFGDISHYAYLFIAIKYSGNLAINFFEEGTSHYIIDSIRKKYSNTIYIRIKKIIIDFIIYRSLGVRNFSRYLYSTEDTDFDFIITKKYSILPEKSSSYLERIKFDSYLSPETELLIQREKNQAEKYENHYKILFLSQTATYMFSDPFNDETAILNKFFDRFRNTNSVVFLKFHPKDRQDKKEHLSGLFEVLNIPHYTLLRDSVIPVELLFTELQPDMIVGYVSSSMIYATSIIPETPVVTLFPALIAYYHGRGISNSWVENNLNYFKHTLKDLFNMHINEQGEIHE